MKTIEVPLEEWERLVEVSKQQMTYRSPFYNKTRWPVVLSTNAKGDGWSFKTYGHTPFSKRAPVDGIKFLEELRREYLAVKPGGGRVFLDTKGAYYNRGKDRQGKEVKFVALNIPGIRYIVKPSATSYRTPQKVKPTEFDPDLT
jgi:hypothetical protein